MPNITPLDVEMKILQFIEQYPSYGPVRIADELKKGGTEVTASAVYNVLRRHNLNRSKQRLEYVRIKKGVVVKPTDLDRDSELSKHRSLKTRYPGHIVGMDVFYVGTLKGTGRIYQLTAIDTYSSYAWAKLYTDKSAVSACERLNRTILEEFYQVAFRSKIYESVDELNNDLARFIEYYNCQRTHHGKRTKGKVPAWLYLLHLAA